MPIKPKNLQLWKKLSKRPQRKLISKGWLYLMMLLHHHSPKKVQCSKIKLSKSLNLSKKLNKKLFWNNLPVKKNKENLSLNKTLSLKQKLLMPKRKDNKKKFSQKKELWSLNNFKKKRQLKSLRLKRKNKSSLLLKLFRRPKLLLPRKLPPKQI